MNRFNASFRPVLGHYAFPIILLVSITAGSLTGLMLGEQAGALKPLGDIFLNLLFTAVVPLVFFSISSAIAGMKDLKKVGKILGWMLILFILTGIISALFMISVMKIFPPLIQALPDLPAVTTQGESYAAARIVQAFTVPDFAELLTKRNMLALIVFSMGVGLATSSSGEKAGLFADFLAAASLVMNKIISFIMLYAPVGLFGYFAYLTGVFGPELLNSYLRAVLVYYPAALVYFFVFYTSYTYFAGGRDGVRNFWSRISVPAAVALGTGSSIATIPANLKAADEIGVPGEISRIVIPVGATLHMDGTCLSAILKISILFSLFQIPFTGVETYALAIGMALLSGMVMSGIPGGGFLGELLIVTLYGFPPEALPVIAVVGTLVDPPATMVNATGDSVVSMMIARILGGKRWFENAAEEHLLDSVAAG